MQKISGIYTRSRMGIDSRVWLTLLITALISVGLFGFKIITTEPCYEITIKLRGVVEHPFANNYFVGESIIFKAGMQKVQKVVWDFGDATVASIGNKVTHIFTKEGNFLVTATVNGKCMQSINVHISQVGMTGSSTVVSAPVDPNGIIGKDFATAGELSIFQTGAMAAAYEWRVEGKPEFPLKNGSKVSYSFTEAGTYIINLKLDNDETKVYRKTVIVSLNPIAAKGADIDELPPLPLPAPPTKGGGSSAEEAGGVAGAGETTTATAEKKYEVIPDPILTRQLQDVVEGKETIENIAKNMCDGMNTKVKGNGKIYANVSLFAEELKGKKGMLGLGGKRKIKSVRANRETGNNCIYLLNVEYK